jgi:Protein of unknown function (DUF5672)
MIDRPGILPARLHTTHGTVLYVEPGAAELRHGGLDGNPANAGLVGDGTAGRIVYEAAGSLRPIVCLADRSHTAADGGNDDGPMGPTVFEIVPLYRRWIGLKAEGRFLCAEPDGRVTLSREVVSAWESFLPSPAGFGENAPSLSISCIETREITKAVRAVERTLQCIRADCLYWFSNTPYPKPLPGTEIINVEIPAFTNFVEDINRICLRLMPRVVTADFNLTVQSDGFAINPQAWDDRFWEYDYIGAAWPWMWGGGPYWLGPIVGNGGFSLRSRRLFQALLELEIKWGQEHWRSDHRINRREYYGTSATGERYLVEDLLICLWYRERLEEEFGIRFCPPEIANKFSVETVSPFTHYWLGRSFGFHGLAAAPYYGVGL